MGYYKDLDIDRRNNMAGIKELKEAVNGTFDLADEGLKIKKSGVKSAMGDIFAMYSSITTAVDGAGDIAAEVADIDESEAQELATLFATRFNQFLLNAGVAANSRAAKALKAVPRVLALAQHNYTEGKAIYEELK